MSRTKQFEESIDNPFSSRIGRRIILIMVLLSATVTLFTTLLQLFWDYKEQFNSIEQRQLEIRDVHAPLLAESLWSFDLTSLQQRLDGLVNLPRVAYLRINSDDYVFQAGDQVTESMIASTYPLLHKSPQTSVFERVGSIYVESNAQDVYDYLIRQFIYTLLLNMFRTLVVCSIVLMIFHKSINQRLFTIAQYLRTYNPRHPAKALQLPRYQWISENEDELDWLGDETNKITSSVSLLYQNIRQEQLRLNDFALISSDWLWETDENGYLIYCSESMQSALELNPDSKPHFLQVEALKDCHTLHGFLKRQGSFSKCEEQLTLHCINYYLMFQAHARFEQDNFLGFRGTAINITELKIAQLELEELNQNLEHTVAVRTMDLKQSMKQLQKAQDQLVEQEKLAALGGLVAGVAHEVNTPLGIAVTATSVIRDSNFELNHAFKNQTLTSTQFETVMTRINESTSMLEGNLNRAAKLIRDFKQTAVDQVSESRCQFNVNQVLDALIASLHPETRKVPVEPKLIGNAALQMNSLPGVLTQVISNLVLNSVNHAFDDTPNATINIEFMQSDENIIFIYRDNGVGVDSSLHHKIFEPFYTSKRNCGGSGLGLNLVFNLITQKLKGQLKFESTVGEGVCFTLTVPQNLPSSVSETDSSEAEI
ncbi:PAS domain-containing sensor histidine kinase [Vibrio atypicus]|uniref:PAS domain-containing sensor histidine kinase n=1 Tax=Vibrio atypicus TaxID=558271 RepID=UPI0013594A99|nr:ATP-binding protein [Vibrio atypicus]